MIVKTNSQIASGGFSLAGTAWQPNATLSVFGGQSNPNARGGVRCVRANGSSPSSYFSTWGSYSTIMEQGGGTYTDLAGVTKTIALKFATPTLAGNYSYISTDGYYVTVTNGSTSSVDWSTTWMELGFVIFAETNTYQQNYTDAALIQWLKTNMALVSQIGRAHV